MTVWQWAGVIMAIIGLISFIIVSFLYEQEPVKPDSFGAFHSRALPWISLFCTGLGLYLGSVSIPVVIFFLSFFLAGPAVHAIATLLRQKS